MTKKDLVEKTKKPMTTRTNGIMLPWLAMGQEFWMMMKKGYIRLPPK